MKKISLFLLTYLLTVNICYAERIGATSSNPNVNISNATIEQTTGAVHNDKNIAVGGKDSAGNVQPIKQDTTGAVQVDVESITAGDNNIGNVDIASVPADPFGLNADAASATGSISAKLRFIAATGIPITSFPDNEPFNVAQINGVTPLMGNGATGTGSPRVTIANDNTDIPIKIIPQTSGGWSVMNATSGDGHTALTNSAQVIKASAGQWGGYYIYNPNATAIYVHVYNVAAASVTVGTTTALLNYCLPAGAAANLEIVSGIPFDTAMSWSATTTGGGNTAPTTALEAMALYK